MPTPTSSTRSPGLDIHPLNRLKPAGMQRRSEGEVVDLGELVVDPFDEIIFDGRDGKRPGRDIGARDQFVCRFGFSFE